MLPSRFLVQKMLSLWEVHLTNDRCVMTDTEINVVISSPFIANSLS